MIAAFNINPAIATKHEAMIGRAMAAAEKGRKMDKAPSKYREHGNTKNIGTTKANHNMMEDEWQSRATLVRTYLKKHPGARTTDIAEGLGINVRTIIHWCDKFRLSPDKYKIKYSKNMATKKYNYWREGDTPKFGDAK